MNVFALKIVLLVVGFCLPLLAFGTEYERAWLLENPEKIPELLHTEKLSYEELPNPHWQQDSCLACHQGEMSAGRAMPPLRESDINQLCGNCHDPTVVAEYIHPVGMEAAAEFRSRMPAEFSDSLDRGKGLVTCITCHDLPMQCLSQRSGEREKNPLFFRGGPYETRTHLCFNCHNPEDYRRKNPHDQITDEGELDTESCFYCHETTPNRSNVRDIYDVTFNVSESLEKLCTGCHPYKPHPGGAWFSSKGNVSGGGANHLRVPPDEVLQKIIRSRKELDIVLPLEPETGRIFCATCHNPHERGVQFLHRADKGADGYKRLRRGKFNVCSSCHNL